MVLRSQNILGLNRAPCLAVFLERLPLLLQDQYNYERVISETYHLKLCSNFLLCVSAQSSSSLSSLYTQSHVAAGDQLVHSAFLQSLASLAVGLSLEKHLCCYPRPPHHTFSDAHSCPSEWIWLVTYATTVRSAEAIASGTAFPESFVVSEFQDVQEVEIAKALVSGDSRLLASFQVQIG